MTYKRLVPRIVVTRSSTSGLVKYKSILTREYKPFRVIGDPLKQQSILQSHVVDEIVLINKSVDSSLRRDVEFEAFISSFCGSLVTPLTVGGGIRSFNQAQALFELGVDKIVVSRKGLNQTFLTKVVNSYGSQAIAFSFDYQELDLVQKDELKKRFELILSMGFGEIFLNNITRDGSTRGLDLYFLREVLELADLPVVVGCGANSVANLAEAFMLGASGVSISTFLSGTDQSPKQIRAHLKTLGVKIRVSE